MVSKADFIVATYYFLRNYVYPLFKVLMVASSPIKVVVYFNENVMERVFSIYVHFKDLDQVPI